MRAKHIYRNRFTSGNVATLAVTLPLPFDGTLQWRTKPSDADMAEFPRWRDTILEHLSTITGRKNHRLVLKGSPYKTPSGHRPEGQPVRASDA